jgi:hypothetical protein
MEWDKSYQDDIFDQEDEHDDLAQGMMTDYDHQQMNAAKADIFKCNIVFRKNLVQVLFCLLLMIICTLQIEAENQFVINQTMRDYIYRLKKVDYATSIKDLAVWSKDRGVSNGNKAAPVNGQIPSFNL